MSAEMKDPFEQLLKSQLSASLSRPSVEPCPDENWMAAYLEGSQSATLQEDIRAASVAVRSVPVGDGFLLKHG